MGQDWNWRDLMAPYLPERPVARARLYGSGVRALVTAEAAREAERHIRLLVDVIDEMTDKERNFVLAMEEKYDRYEIALISERQAKWLKDLTRKYSLD